MSDFGDVEYEDYEDDWMYVEDYWDEANELAEHTCPSPMPSNENSPDEYDVHDYWQDIEYISDGGYYEDHQTPTKRKLGAKSPRHLKKRKLGTPAANAVGPISWMTQLQRHETQNNVPLVMAGTTQSTALLKDWNSRFKDAPGLASVPKVDSEREEAEGAVSGDGFDLKDVQSVAGLLSEENLGALQEMLTSKGMDPSAVEEVLRDLIAGKERAFNDDEDPMEDESDANEDEEGEEEEGYGEFEQQGNQLDDKSAEYMPDMGPSDNSLTAHESSGSSQLGPSYLNVRQSGSFARGSKRVGEIEDGGLEDADDGPARRRKRHKDSNYETENDKSSQDSPLHVSHVNVSENSSGSTRTTRTMPTVSKDDARRTRSGRGRRR